MSVHVPSPLLGYRAGFRPCTGRHRAAPRLHAGLPDWHLLARSLCTPAPGLGSELPPLTELPGPLPCPARTGHLDSPSQIGAGWMNEKLKHDTDHPLQFLLREEGLFTFAALRWALFSYLRNRHNSRNREAVGRLALRMGPSKGARESSEPGTGRNQEPNIYCKETSRSHASALPI